MIGNSTAIVPASHTLVVEMWQLMNDRLEFVPQLTEEARDWYLRRNYKPSGSILVHGPLPFKRKRVR